MTTYFTITEAMTDSDRFIPAELAKAWWKNPLAIGEADATVPANLLPTVFLGSANTTTGTSVAVTGLNLAPYKTLKVFVDILASGSPSGMSINGRTFIIISSSGPTVSGLIEVDLLSGIYSSATSIGSGGGSLGPTNASTSITIAVSGGSFSGGSFRIYGCK